MLSLPFALQNLPYFNEMQGSRSCVKHGIVSAGDQQGRGGPALPHAAAGKPGACESHAILENQDNCVECGAGQKKGPASGACLGYLCLYRSFLSFLCGRMQENGHWLFPNKPAFGWE